MVYYVHRNVRHRGRKYFLLTGLPPSINNFMDQRSYPRHVLVIRLWTVSRDAFISSGRAVIDTTYLLILLGHLLRQSGS